MITPETVPQWIQDLWTDIRAACQAEGREVWRRARTPREFSGAELWDWLAAWREFGRAELLRKDLIVWWWHQGGDRAVWPTPDVIQAAAERHLATEPTA